MSEQHLQCLKQVNKPFMSLRTIIRNANLDDCIQVGPDRNSQHPFKVAHEHHLTSKLIIMFWIRFQKLIIWRQLTKRGYILAKTVGRDVTCKLELLCSENARSIPTLNKLLLWQFSILTKLNDRIGKNDLLLKLLPLEIVPQIQLNKGGMIVQRHHQQLLFDLVTTFQVVLDVLGCSIK